MQSLKGGLAREDKRQKKQTKGTNKKTQVGRERKIRVSCKKVFSLRGVTPLETALS